MKRNDNRRILHYFIDNEGGIHVLKIYIYIYIQKQETKEIDVLIKLVS